MTLYRDIFGYAKVLLAVVHVRDVLQAVSNVERAQQAHADGVFLINHGNIDADGLFHAYREVRDHFPDFWVGVNCLDLTGAAALECLGNSDLAPRVSGLWLDNAGISEYDPNQPAAEHFGKWRSTSTWDGIYFGSVAFKGQRPVGDLAYVAQVATRYCDVITTSGSGTGIAANPDKVKSMRSVIGNHPLALASGITPENVEDFLPHIDCALVSTGISHSFHELDSERVFELAEKMHSWTP